MRLTVRRSLLLLPATLIATMLVAGCAGGAAASGGTSPQASPETRSSIATAIALKAAQSAANPAKQPMPSAPRTAAEISATASTSGLLETTHLAAGKGCDACHGSLPSSGQPAPVTTTKCFSCHGGSYEAIAAKTAGLGARNPHKAHTGKEDCDRCHHVHQPFEFSCNACHTFPVPTKYAEGSSGAVSTAGSQPPGSGATYKETED